MLLWSQEEYTGPYDQKLHTHRPFKVCLCIVYLSFLHGEMPLRAEGAKKYAASTVGGIMRAEMYSIALPVNLSHR